MSSVFGFLLMGIVVIGLLLLTLQGVILIKAGFWPRRRGSEPYCRACGYLLIGIDSQRCPECGTVLSPSAIVHGQRRRRLGLGWGGVVMVLPLAAMLGSFAIHQFPAINWYHYEPTFLVMRDLRSSSAGDSYRAILELKQRDQAGDLSSKYEQQIVEVALVEQATKNQTQLSTELISFLEAQCLAGNLTDSQKTQFGQQSLTLSLHVRPIIVLGNSVPFRINENCRVTGSPWWVRLSGEKAQIDGKPIRGFSGGSSSMAGLGSGGAIGSSVECLDIGKHVLQQSVHVELHTGVFDGNDPKNLVFQYVCKLSDQFEVVAQPPAGDFTVVNDPTLHDLIKSKIQPHQFTLGLRNHYLQGEFKIDMAPANLAFEVIARQNGQQFYLGTIICNKGSSTDYNVGVNVGRWTPTSPLTAVDIILRSSEQAARQTIDQHDMWNGELAFPNVSVSVSKGP
jgi:hypothetical protein